MAEKGVNKRRWKQILNESKIQTCPPLAAQEKFWRWRHRMWHICWGFLQKAFPSAGTFCPKNLASCTVICYHWMDWLQYSYWNKNNTSEKPTGQLFLNRWPQCYPKSTEQRGVGVQGGLKPVLRSSNFTLDSVVGHIHIEVVRSTWRTSTHQWINTANIKIKFHYWDETRWVLNSKPTLKCWSNRSPTMEPQWARPKTQKLKVSKPLNEYSYYVTIMLYTLPISVMW